MSNILNILLVSPAKTGTSKANKPYSIVETHCMLVNESGETVGVGMFVLPRDVPQDLKPGYYAPVFDMVSATFGDSKGEVVSRIVGLTPLDAGAIKRLQAPKPVSSAALAPA